MFGLPHSKKQLIQRIERCRSKLSTAADEDLRDEANQLRFRIKSNEAASITPSLFALVAEAAQRSLGYSHRRCQFEAGYELTKQRIVELETGQGKTLTATLPLVMFAMAGKGCHLATSNDYLAKRDADAMRPIFELLGLSCGYIQEAQDDQERRSNYACDITYGTAAQFGFDFLRDRLKRNLKASGDFVDDEVQRELHTILADEADALMIDEADTPLVLAAGDSSSTRSPALYRWAANACGDCEDQHYEFEHRTNTVKLTEDGRRWARSKLDRQAISGTSVLNAFDCLELAVMVKICFQRDRHYVVRNNNIVLINKVTGRLGENQEWQEGIQQAIQAKEGLKVTAASSHSAKLTVQALFQSYLNCAGMTGSAIAAKNEFSKVYGKKVVSVASHQESKRKRLPTLRFKSEEEKLVAVCEEIRRCHSAGQPVLVGTRSVEKSERLATMLAKFGIRPAVLNATRHQYEARIIAGAGQTHQVTVATEMAGRGTDIKPSKEAIAAGGLHVILSELNISPRQDQQIIGRCGRQGQPGTYRLFLSQDDEILKEAYGKDGEANLKFESAFRKFGNQHEKAQEVVEQRRKQRRVSALYHEKKRLRALVDMGQDPVLQTV